MKETDTIYFTGRNPALSEVLRKTIKNFEAEINGLRTKIQRRLFRIWQPVNKVTALMTSLLFYTYLIWLVISGNCPTWYCGWSRYIAVFQGFSGGRDVRFCLPWDLIYQPPSFHPSHFELPCSFPLVAVALLDGQRTMWNAALSIGYLYFYR
jgi:hypothetical protein